MSSSAARCSFDDIVIDFVGHRLLRNGAEQLLEPKAFAVLALLAGEPGRVFTRDEILDAVWGHQHLTPGVLNRVMTLLRQALGEDAHHPRSLHTVHGVGYRFDLPSPDSAGTSTPAMDTWVPAARSEAVSTDVIATVTTATLGRQWKQPLFLLLALVAMSVVGSSFWLRDRNMVSAVVGSKEPTQSATPSLVVMPLKPIGSGDSVRVIADGLGEELIFRLAKIDGLRVIARDSTRRAAAESDDPARLAQRLGITHALEGNLQQAGQSLRVRLRLVDAQEGRALWTRDFDRDASEVLLLQREIAEAVASSLMLELGLAQTPSRSGDADFLRRYLSARALVKRRDLPPEASAEKAEIEFRELVRERADDARAHAGLALALEVRAQRRPSLAASLREEAVREAKLAQGLDPTLPDPYFVLSFNACYRSEWEDCLRLGSQSPSDAGMVYSNAIMVARLGYLDRAEAVARELAARDPLNISGGYLLGRILDMQGRHDEARAALDSFSIDDGYVRWFNAVWRKDYATALRIAETQIAEPDHPDAIAAGQTPGYIAASRALIDPSLWPQAELEFQRFERATGLMNFSLVLTPDAPDHAPDLVRRLDDVRHRGYSSWDLLLWTKDLAFLRRDPAFQDYLRDNGILEYWKKHGFPEQCRPQGEGAVCD